MTLSIENNILHTTENKYIPIALAGSGRHGNVWFCISNWASSSNVSADLVAVKAPRRSSQDELAREAAVLQEIQDFLTHTNKGAMQKHFPFLIDSSPNYLALTPILGFSLKQLIDTVKSLPHKPAVPKILVLHVARQLLSASAFLHDVKLCHRDLWEGNVMLGLHSESNRMPDVVIIDFGNTVKETEEQRLAWERSCVYAVVERLGVVNRQNPKGADEKHEKSAETDRFWNDFMDFLAAMAPSNRGGEIISFAQFKKKFGSSIETRLNNLDVEEMREAESLLETVAVAVAARREGRP